jgi:cell division protein FtsB
MILRIIAVVLLAALVALQYRIWASPGGMREVWRLEKAIEVQQQENERLAERNRTLAAEVRDLKEGRAAIEERARTDLGMVKSNETFFQVVPPARATATAPGEAPADSQAPVEPAPAQPRQRTAQAEVP